MSLASPTLGEVVNVGGGYAIAMCNSRCVVVCLRRARERVLYEEILRSTMTSAVPTQRLFFSEELTLSLEEYQLLELHATEFAALGFEIDYRGEGVISVAGRPAILDQATPIDELLYELLHGIEHGKMPIDEERRRLAELMARRGSAGYERKTKTSEAEEIIRALLKCDDYSFTASGTPIMAEITHDELRAKLAKK